MLFFLALWAKGEPLNFSGAHFLEMSKLQGKAGRFAYP